MAHNRKRADPRRLPPRRPLTARTVARFLRNATRVEARYTESDLPWGGSHGSPADRDRQWAEPGVPADKTRRAIDTTYAAARLGLIAVTDHAASLTRLITDPDLAGVLACLQADDALDRVIRVDDLARPVCLIGRHQTSVPTRRTITVPADESLVDVAARRSPEPRLTRLERADEAALVSTTRQRGHRREAAQGDPRRREARRLPLPGGVLGFIADATQPAWSRRRVVPTHRRCPRRPWLTHRLPRFRTALASV